MLVRFEELTSLWYLFVIKYYDDNPLLTSLLQHSRVAETEKGSEVIIWLRFSEHEDILNTYMGEFKRLLSQDSEFTSLLPVYFTYFRLNGTKVQAEEYSSFKNRYSPFLLEELRQSVKDGLQTSAFRVFIDEEQDNLHSMISNQVLFSDELPAKVEKCRKSFKRLIGASDKADEKGPSFDCADYLISVVKKPLSKIEIELGTSSDYFKYAYNFLVTKYLDIVLDSVFVTPSLSGLNKASMQLEQFDSSVLTVFSKESIKRTRNVLHLLGQSTAYRQRAQEVEKDSRLSRRIKDYALSHWWIQSGNKRYSSPPLALFALIVLWFASIVSLFERIASLFKKKR